ncbi:MAG: glycosyltransferase [Eubacteriales bacterium]
MKLSVCIPMYNESLIAADTAAALWQAMDALRRAHGWDFEIIFADDGSRDDCAERVRAAAAEKKLDGVRVVGYENNRGKGAAVRTAVLASDGDLVFYTDCDLAYGTDVIGQAAAWFTEETDAVIGSRRLSGDGYESYTPLRRLASGIYVRVLCMVGGFRLSDSQCGFKAFRGPLARKIFAQCATDGFAFDFEVLMLAGKLGARIREMPVRIINHRASTVHLFRDSARMLRDMVRIKRRVRTVKFN